MCDPKALSLVGESLSVEQVMREIERDVVFYARSGGGVTLSGGEPLSQPEFTGEVARRCKARGIPVALDTSGFASWEVVEGVLDSVDLVLYDIKSMDPILHRELTGVPNDIILDNARRISLAGLALVLRVPVIPGLNDSPENLRALAEFARGLPRLSGVDLLPYHRLGLPKYSMLGMESRVQGLQQPSREYITKVQESIEACGVKVRIVA